MNILKKFAIFVCTSSVLFIAEASARAAKHPNYKTEFLQKTYLQGDESTYGLDNERHFDYKATRNKFEPRHQLDYRAQRESLPIGSGYAAERSRQYSQSESFAAARETVPVESGLVSKRREYFERNSASDLQGPQATYHSYVQGPSEVSQRNYQTAKNLWNNIQYPDKWQEHHSVPSKRKSEHVAAEDLRYNYKEYPPIHFVSTPKPRIAFNYEEEVVTTYPKNTYETLTLPAPNSEDVYEEVEEEDPYYAEQEYDQGIAEVGPDDAEQEYDEEGLNDADLDLYKEDAADPIDAEY